MFHIMLQVDKLKVRFILTGLHNMFTSKKSPKFSLTIFTISKNQFPCSPVPYSLKHKTHKTQTQNTQNTKNIKKKRIKDIQR
jgi:hypothetical protein